MDSPIYRERVLPAPATFLLPLLLAILIYTMFLPIDEFVGIVGSATAAIAMTIVLVAKAPKIEVTAENLLVGRAEISRKYLAAAEIVSAEESFEARGHKLDANAYTSFQGSVKTMIKVAIADKNDPTPYWLFTTRHPEDLVKALS